LPAVPRPKQSAPRQRLAGWHLQTDIGMFGDDSLHGGADKSRRARLSEGRRMLKALREDLAEQRRAGESFDSAAAPAVTRAIGELNHLQRLRWARALEETRGGWARAYLNLPDVMAARVAELETVA
jgi:hypothetical protein